MSIFIFTVICLGLFTWILSIGVVDGDDIREYFKNRQIRKYCKNIGITVEQFEEAKTTAKEKLDEFIEEAIQEYFRKINERESERIKEESWQYRSRFDHQNHKESIQKPTNIVEQHKKVLGIPLTITLNETIIITSFKKAALKAHPDKGGTKEEFLRIQT